MSPFLVVAIVAFGTGAFLGFFVTGFWLPSPDAWWQPLLARVVWQLGSAIALSVALLLETRSVPRSRGSWSMVVVFPLVGALLCASALLDLADGPHHLEGPGTVDIDDGGRSIFATIRVEHDGGTEELELSGWRVNAVQDRLAACPSDATFSIDALVHTGVILSLSCTAPP